MAKLIKKENSNWAIGVIGYVAQNDPNVTNLGMTLREWDSTEQKEISTYFSMGGWDNSLENGASANLPDRIKKAKIQPGSLLLCACGKVKDGGVAENGTPRQQATLYNFRFTGLVEGDTETVVLGRIGKVEKKGDALNVSLAYDAYNKEAKQQETKWITATFTGGVISAVEKVAAKGKPFAAIGTLEGDTLKAKSFVAQPKQENT